MMNIRPISDLRNKFTEIEDLVVEKNEEVFLTKNGYGAMVVMSMEKFSKLAEEHLRNQLKERYGDKDMEKIIDEMEREIDDPNTKFLTHDEVFSKARRILDGEM